mgnify:FL=1
MNSLIMLRMALNHLKEYSSNEWVIEGDKKYNIDTVLSRIKVAEEDFTNFKGRMPDSLFKLHDDCKDETYSEKMQNELEPISFLDTKLKLYEELGVHASGYYESYANHLPRLIKEIKDRAAKKNSNDND